VLLCFLSLTALACGPRARPAGLITVVDDAGDTVALARSATRVVSLIPAATEVLFAVGAGDQVVGRTAWCDYPADALSVPNLGDGLEPSLEGIVAVRPDLVVLYPSPRTALAAGQLRKLGVATIQLRTDRLGDLDRAIGLLGAVTGHASAADSVRRRLREDLASARRTPARRPTMLLLAWDQPPIAIGAGSFLGEIVELAGGRNLFDDLDAPSAPVSLEAIAIRDPDLVLTSSDSAGLTDRPEWQVVRAVRERRFVRMTGTEFMRPTPRAASAVTTLARVLEAAGWR
jgi:ABC-type Fe3+-hydroxamate transport system substrate-binding protein